MKLKRFIHIIVLCAGFLGLSAKPVSATASLELYGTFHAMGVIVTVDLSDDPNSNAVAQVEYRESGTRFALVLLAHTRGSVPQEPGARMIVTENCDQSPVCADAV